MSTFYSQFVGLNAVAADLRDLHGLDSTREAETVFEGGYAGHLLRGSSRRRVHA